MKDIIQSNSGVTHKSGVKGDHAGRKHKGVKEGINAPSQQTIVQPKLELTTPGDSYEREADRMADFVMRKAYSGLPTEMPSTSSVLPPLISRRASSSTSGVAVDSATESGIHASRGGGHPMPTALRSQMESGFETDFSRVRLHTGSAAEAMSNDLRAKAFTYGNDIYFNRGQYSPDTTAGQHLIAHELTHVVQQSGKVGREEEENEEDKIVNEGTKKDQDKITTNYDKWIEEQEVRRYNNNIDPKEDFKNSALKNNGMMFMIQNSMITAVYLIHKTQYWLKYCIDEETGFENIKEILRQKEDEESELYSSHIRDKEYYRNLVTTILSSPNFLSIVFNNLDCIRTEITKYDFYNFKHIRLITNENRMQTYGVNKDGKIGLSDMFFEHRFTNKDRAYAIIHEFAHSVLHNSGEELYIDNFEETEKGIPPRAEVFCDIFNTLNIYNKEKCINDIIKTKIINSPDFYVLLCYLFAY